MYTEMPEPLCQLLWLALRERLADPPEWQGWKRPSGMMKIHIKSILPRRMHEMCPLQ